MSKFKDYIGRKLYAKCQFMGYTRKNGDSRVYAIFCNINNEKGELVSDCLTVNTNGVLASTELHDNDIIGLEIKVEATEIEITKVDVLKRVNHEVTAVKKWKDDSYIYFKFITNVGPKWFKVSRTNNSRIFRVYIGAEDDTYFESKLQMDPTDDKYVKHILSKDLKLMVKSLPLVKSKAS